MSHRQKSGKDKKKRRNALYVHQKGVCFWCPTLVFPGTATIDELLPRSKGGSQRWSNIVMSCKPCNTKRGNKPAPAWATELVRLRGEVSS